MILEVRLILYVVEVGADPMWEMKAVAIFCGCSENGVTKVTVIFPAVSVVETDPVW